MKLVSYSCCVCGRTSRIQSAKRHEFNGKEYFTCRSTDCLRKFLVRTKGTKK